MKNNTDSQIGDVVKQTHTSTEPAQTLFPSVTLPVVDPTAEMMELMRSMQTQLTDLKQSQDKLTIENSTLREELNARNAEPLGNNVVGDDFPPSPNAARSAVVGTRPVLDDPARYRRNGKVIVDAGGLSVNDSSPLSGKNRE